MDNINIEVTKYTPQILLDHEAGLIEFKGKSYPENTFEFYKPIIDWINEYFENPQDETTVNFHITYFNSSSSKLFFDLFDIFEEAHDNDVKVVINWLYDEENESALEAGEDFKDDFENLVINLVAIEE